MSVELRDRPFDPWRILADHQQARRRPGDHGATAVFVGSMRDFNENETVDGMFLEHYPGMTERELETIVDECRGRHEVLDVLVVHRVGAITPGEAIVLVSVWSAHRAAAFAVCRAIMEALKQRAPFWKRESTDTGARWVEQNTPGD